jgi:emfourin
MRITFQADGGLGYFPGLNRPITIDTDALAQDEAARVHGLVRAARFFERPGEVAAPGPGAADYRRYTISIEDGERSHSVVTTDPVADPSLQALIDHLQAAQRRSLEA